MCVPVANKGFNGLYIEMKRSVKSLSTVSEHQKHWIERLREQGYRVEICYGAEEAKKVIGDYYV